MKKYNLKAEDKIYFPYMLASIPFIYIGFILPFYSKELNMDSVQIAGLSSIFSFIVLILRPFIGKISDKIGRKPILIASLILYSISFCVYSFATCVEILYLARAIQAIASPMMGLSVYCLIVDYSKENEEYANHLGEKFGKLDVYSTRGGIIGIILINIIFNYVPDFMNSWKWFLYICCLANLIAIILIIKNVKETRRIDPKTSIKAKILILTTNIKKLMVINLVLGSFSSLLSSLFMLFLIDKFDAGVYELGFTYMLPLILSGILPKYIGRYGDKLGRIKSMTISLLLSCVLTFIFPNVNNLFATSIVYCLMMIVDSLYGTASSALFANETGIEDRGQLRGTYSTIIGLGDIIGPIIGGFLYKNLSVNVPFYLSGLGYIITLILIIILFRNYTTSKKLNDNLQ